MMINYFQKGTDTETLSHLSSQIQSVLLSLELALLIPPSTALTKTRVSVLNSVFFGGSVSWSLSVGISSML